MEFCVEEPRFYPVIEEVKEFFPAKVTGTKILGFIGDYHPSFCLGQSLINDDVIERLQNSLSIIEKHRVFQPFQGIENTSSLNRQELKKIFLETSLEELLKRYEVCTGECYKRIEPDFWCSNTDYFFSFAEMFFALDEKGFLNDERSSVAILENEVFRINPHPFETNTQLAESVMAHEAGHCIGNHLFTNSEPGVGEEVRAFASEYFFSIKKGFSKCFIKSLNTDYSSLEDFYFLQVLNSIHEGRIPENFLKQVLVSSNPNLYLKSFEEDGVFLSLEQLESNSRKGLKRMGEKIIKRI